MGGDGVLGADAGGDDRLPAQRRDQARPRRDGRVCWLRRAVPGLPLPMGPDVVGRLVRGHLGRGKPAGAVGRAAYQLKAVALPLDRLPRVVGRELVRAPAVGRETLHARRQARRVPVLQQGWHPAPRAVRALRPLRPGEERFAREKGTWLARRDQQWAPRHAGHHGLRLRGQGPRSVPALKGPIAPYAGNPMGPFTAADAQTLPYVSEMLSGPFAF